MLHCCLSQVGNDVVEQGFIFWKRFLFSKLFKGFENIWWARNGFYDVSSTVTNGDGDCDESDHGLAYGSVRVGSESLWEMPNCKKEKQLVELSGFWYSFYAKNPIR